MKSAIVVLFLVLCSCTKDQVEIRRPIVEVVARMCAMEITEGDKVIRDTIIGQMVYDGGVSVDTISGTALYNLALREGEGMSVRVTHLRIPAMDGQVCIKVRGDITGIACSGDSIVSFVP